MCCDRELSDDYNLSCWLIIDIIVKLSIAEIIGLLAQSGAGGAQPPLLHSPLLPSPALIMSVLNTQRPRQELIPHCQHLPMGGSQWSAPIMVTAKKKIILLLSARHWEWVCVSTLILKNLLLVQIVIWTYPKMLAHYIYKRTIFWIPNLLTNWEI